MLDAGESGRMPPEATMTDIQTLIVQLSTRQQPASRTLAQTPAARGNAAADPRTVRDTVTLSDGGQKIVNLARGNELAAEFRSKPVDEGFFAALARAREDVLRIGRLFTETIKAAFQQARK